MIDICKVKPHKADQNIKKTKTNKLLLRLIRRWNEHYYHEKLKEFLLYNMETLDKLSPETIS
jgi:hypothetical protein